MASVGGPKYNTHHTPTQPLRWDKDTPQAEGTFLEFLPSYLTNTQQLTHKIHKQWTHQRDTVWRDEQAVIVHYVYKHPIIQFYFKSEAFNVYTWWQARVPIRLLDERQQWENENERHNPLITHTIIYSMYLKFAFFCNDDNQV